MPTVKSFSMDASDVFIHYSAQEIHVLLLFVVLYLIFCKRVFFMNIVNYLKLIKRWQIALSLMLSLQMNGLIEK